MDANRSARVPLVLVVVLGALFLASLSFFIYHNIQAGDNAAWQLIISTLLLAVPLGLLYFSIGVLVVAWLHKRSQGLLGARLAKFIYRTPRIAGILIIVFVSLFALDMFGGNEPWWKQLLGFVIHALPAILLAGLMVVAWRWEWVGFAAFLLAAVVFMRFVIGSPQFGFGNFLLFVSPMTLIALLFWAGWKWRDEIRSYMKKEPREGSQ